MPYPHRGHLVLGALTSGCAFALAACTWSGGATTVTGDNGSCTQVTVPSINLAPPTAPTTLPGVQLAPCPTTPPTTTAPPTTAPPTTPPTTVPPTTTPPTTSTAPPPPANTAAAKFGWGTPLAASDEFTGTTVDGSKWGQPGECWPANSTVVNGRCKSHNSISGGIFTETGTSDGKTGYLSSTFGQKYGRWEVRMRVVSGSGKPFHPVLLLWPDSEQWPSGGEYDFFEDDSNDTTVTAFLHHPDGSQDHYESGPVDISAWHSYGFEWTSSGLTGYIDGNVWFHDTKSSAQAPGPMHMTAQLDDPNSTSGMAPTTMQLDWARVYHL